MNGTDKDLAAHFTIIYHRGKTLYGKEIKSVFSEVSNEAYMDSIWLDVKNAKEDIIDDAMYIRTDYSSGAHPRKPRSKSGSNSCRGCKKSCVYG